MLNNLSLNSAYKSDKEKQQIELKMRKNYIFFLLLYLNEYKTEITTHTHIQTDDEKFSKQHRLLCECASLVIAPCKTIS